MAEKEIEAAYDEINDRPPMFHSRWTEKRQTIFQKFNEKFSNLERSMELGFHPLYMVNDRLETYMSKIYLHLESLTDHTRGSIALIENAPDLNLQTIVERLPNKEHIRFAEKRDSTLIVEYLTREHASSIRDVKNTLFGESSISIL